MNNTVVFNGKSVGYTGMITPAEFLFLAEHTRDNYRGDGFIVDAGCFLGASTIAFANGLITNTHVNLGSPTFGTHRAIQSYDLFSNNLPYYAPYLGARGASSFLDEFLANTRAYAALFDVHPGNILQQEWIGGPIEILFLDIVKSDPINTHVVKRFFRNLIPGRSIVVQQDYIHSFTPWIPSTMEALSGFFGPAKVVATSGIFALERAIPDNVIDTVLRLGIEKRLALIERHSARYDKCEYRNIFALAAPVLCLKSGRSEHGKQLLTKVVEASQGCHGCADNASCRFQRELTKCKG